MRKSVTKFMTAFSAASLVAVSKSQRTHSGVLYTHVLLPTQTPSGMCVISLNVQMNGVKIL